MFVVILLICVSSIAAGDECEPGFADTCFSAVTKSFRYMIDLRKLTEVNVTKAALDDLCLSLDDSLNCTSDIIDYECSRDEGKVVFDSWLSALRAMYSFVCSGVDHKRLADILHGISCWSVDDFLLCVQEKTDLTDFLHIFHSKIDDIECENLYKAVSYCRKKATVGSCREQEDVFPAVDGMINAFFSSFKCETYKNIEENQKNKIYSQNIADVLSPLITTSLSLAFLSLVL